MECKVAVQQEVAEEPIVEERFRRPLAIKTLAEVCDKFSANSKRWLNDIRSLKKSMDIFRQTEFIRPCRTDIDGKGPVPSDAGDMLIPLGHLALAEQYLAKMATNLSVMFDTMREEERAKGETLYDFVQSMRQGVDAEKRTEKIICSPDFLKGVERDFIFLSGARGVGKTTLVFFCLAYDIYQFLKRSRYDGAAAKNHFTVLIGLEGLGEGLYNHFHNPSMACPWFKKEGIFVEGVAGIAKYVKGFTVGIRGGGRISVLWELDSYRRGNDPAYGLDRLLKLYNTTRSNEFGRKVLAFACDELPWFDQTYREQYVLQFQIKIADLQRRVINPYDNRHDRVRFRSWVVFNKDLDRGDTPEIESLGLKGDHTFMNVDSECNVVTLDDKVFPRG